MGGGGGGGWLADWEFIIRICHGRAEVKAVKLG